MFYTDSVSVANKGYHPENLLTALTATSESEANGSISFLQQAEGFFLGHRLSYKTGFIELYRKIHQCPDNNDNKTDYASVLSNACDLICEKNIAGDITGNWGVPKFLSKLSIVRNPDENSITFNYGKHKRVLTGDAARQFKPPAYMTATKDNPDIFQFNKEAYVQQKGLVKSQPVPMDSILDSASSPLSPEEEKLHSTLYDYESDSLPFYSLEDKADDSLPMYDARDTVPGEINKNTTGSVDQQKYPSMTNLDQPDENFYSPSPKPPETNVSEYEPDNSDWSFVDSEDCHPNSSTSSKADDPGYESGGSDDSAPILSDNNNLSLLDDALDDALDEGFEEPGLDKETDNTACDDLDKDWFLVTHDEHERVKKLSKKADDIKTRLAELDRTDPRQNAAVNFLAELENKPTSGKPITTNEIQGVVGTSATFKKNILKHLERQSGSGVLDTTKEMLRIGARLKGHRTIREDMQEVREKIILSHNASFDEAYRYNLLKAYYVVDFYLQLMPAAPVGEFSFKLGSDDVKDNMSEYIQDVIAGDKIKSKHELPRIPLQWDQDVLRSTFTLKRSGQELYNSTADRDRVVKAGGRYTEKGAESLQTMKKAFKDFLSTSGDDKAYLVCHLASQTALQGIAEKAMLSFYHQIAPASKFEVDHKLITAADIQGIAHTTIEEDAEGNLHFSYQTLHNQASFGTENKYTGDSNALTTFHIKLPAGKTKATDIVLERADECNLLIKLENPMRI